MQLKMKTDVGKAVLKRLSRTEGIWKKDRKGRSWHNEKWRAARSFPVGEVLNFGF